MKDNVRTFENPTKTAQAFGDYLMKAVEQSEGNFHCALSGGSTPKILFDYLAEKYPNSALWDRVHFYWGDERCVPPTDSESNYKMTKEHLLDKIDIPDENVHRVLGENDPLTEANRYSHELTTFLPTKNELPVFDLIILGMGTDGHTASIFPHQMELLNSEKICDVAKHPDSGQSRVTLTGKVINQAKEVVFLVTGANKKEKISEIFNQNGNWKTYPSAHIKPVAGKLKWFIDAEAARF